MVKMIFTKKFMSIPFTASAVSLSLAANGSGLCAGGASRHESFNPPLMFN